MTTITHFSLLEKYNGRIRLATTEELREAQKNIPEGKNALQCLIESAREYKKALIAKAKESAKRPSICYDKDGLCEDDLCRCGDDTK